LIADERLHARVPTCANQWSAFHETSSIPRRLGARRLGPRRLQQRQRQDGLERHHLDGACVFHAVNLDAVERHNERNDPVTKHNDTGAFFHTERRNDPDHAAALRLDPETAVVELS